MRYSAEHKAQTRDKLLASSGALAKRGGFSATGVDGLMKAIGLSDRDIRGLYQAKYLVIAGAAALLAAACALPLAGLFTQNIALNFGLSEATALTWLLPPRWWLMKALNNTGERL